MSPKIKSLSVMCAILILIPLQLNSQLDINSFLDQGSVQEPQKEFESTLDFTKTTDSSLETKMNQQTVQEAVVRLQLFNQWKLKNPEYAKSIEIKSFTRTTKVEKKAALQKLKDQQVTVDLVRVQIQTIISNALNAKQV